MERIGIRELRQNASTYVARVAAGESIEVTDRGRPVARLVPIVQAGLKRLESEGRISESKQAPIRPIAWPRRGPRLSDVLQSMRDEDSR